MWKVCRLTYSCRINATNTVGVAVVAIPLCFLMKMIFKLIFTGMTNCKTNTDCEHLCLLTPYGGTCACSNGYQLASDNRSCNGMIFQSFHVLSLTNAIIIWRCRWSFFLSFFPSFFLSLSLFLIFGLFVHTKI